MDAMGFEDRKEELLNECELTPQVFQRVMARLERFMKPFVDCLVRREQVEHACTFVRGLLSDLKHKNAESIAYRFDQERMPLQWFIGMSPWDDDPLRDELASQVGKQLGEADGVIVFDPSAFPKSGKESVGVARQWCGRLGKIDNCQVGITMGYVSAREHTLVDTRLYLPKEWTKDRKRCEKAGIPKKVRYRTRHQLCLDMLAKHGEKLPHAWITGDDEMGRPYWFRRRLSKLGERYLLAVPSNTLVRDLQASPPQYSGHGRPRKRPWTRLDRWLATLADKDWTRVDVRDGTKGPLLVEMVTRPVVGRTDKRQQGHEEVLVVIRYKDRDDRRVVKTDYYLSNANLETELLEFGRAAKAEHRIEECIQRAKSEAGLADYEVRTWRGWHHHQALSLIATWFLVTETRRGGKIHAGAYCSPTSRGDLANSAQAVRMRYTLAPGPRMQEATNAKRACLPVPLEPA
jgi:SRSO17 transposase